jgi:hypothetical protein
VEIVIGIKDLARELTIQTSKPAADIESQVAAALAKPEGSVLSFTDDHGRTTLIPAAAVGFVELGSEAQRRVGFGG